MADSPLIAVVDDDAAVRVSLETLIRSFGYRVRTFESAPDYLLHEAELAADCIVSDVQMPGMTGLEMREALMERGSATPLILMTAFPDDRTQAHASKVGAQCLLKKPFTANSLMDCIEAAIG